MSVRETATQTDNKIYEKYNTLCMCNSTHLVRGPRNHLEAVAAGVGVVRVSVSVREGDRERHIYIGIDIDMIYAYTHLSPNIH